MIDLRSDTVTLPTEEMRAAMAAAPVGDDVYGEDPTVNRLQAMVAERLGKEAAMFVSSGTQSNLTALLSHCQRGDEYIVGQQAHTFKYEAGGAAVLGSIQPQPVEIEADGTLDLEKIRAVVKPDDFHFARTRLLCLENTVHGRVLSVAYQNEATALARQLGLACHLDGARIFNAAVQLNVPVEQLARPFDSVSVCLSKGLGAPAGSVLCGSAELIKEARRWRKMLGGGMRQVGLLAAAGIWALEHQVDRLAEDHANAKALAEGLAEIEGIEVDQGSVQTNMVFASLRNDAREGGDPADFVSHMAEQGISISPDATLRLVTHLNVSASDIDRIVTVAKSFF